MNYGIMNFRNKMEKLHSSMEISDWSSFLDDKGKKIRYGVGNAMKDKETECCLCGDVGLQEHLFKCHRCYTRFQHLYCSRLYSDQLDLDCANVCDWCLDLQAKEKIQGQKSKVESKKMESEKAKMVADSQILSNSASGIAMKQPSSVTKKKPGRANAKLGSPKLRGKLWGSRKNQFGRRKDNQASSPLQDCKVTTEIHRSVPPTSTQRSPSKGGFRRRYKLLSDIMLRSKSQGLLCHPK